MADRAPSLPSPPPIPAQGHGRRLNDRLPAILEQVAAVIRDGVESGKHTNGPRVAALEERMARWLETPAVVGVASGSASLRCAFELMELPPGSEVIVPAYTFVLTAYAVSDAFAVDPRTGMAAKGGLMPVFVDVDPDTYTIDPEQVRAAITERTRAIVAVHMSGQMADMAPLLEIAEEHDLVVVEDAAQAHGAAHRDGATGATRLAGSAGPMAPIMHPAHMGRSLAFSARGRGGWRRAAMSRPPPQSPRLRAKGLLRRVTEIGR